MRKILFTEKQINHIRQIVKESESKYNLDPKKVLIVKNFLDKWFLKGVNMEYIGEDGFYNKQKLVAMKDEKGNQLKNMTDQQLFNLLIERFKGIYPDHSQRNKFLAKVMKAWYNDEISNHGIIKHINRY